MGMTQKMHTPGWRPETGDERLAVVEHCRTLGMSRDEAEKFVRFNAMRRWKCCEFGSVADAAKEWIASAERNGVTLRPGCEDRLEKVAEDVRKLRETVEQVATLLSLVYGKEGETDIGRVVADMLEERDALREFLEYRNGVKDRRLGDGLQREAVEKVEGLEPGGERDGGEGV